MKTFILLLALPVSSLCAQQEALDESFDSGVFPPVGWLEVNNGNSPGWTDSGDGAAFHDDYIGQNDNHLVSKELDLTSFTEAYLHLRHSSHWTAYRGYNIIEASLDGGLTFTTLRVVQTPNDFDNEPFNSNLSYYAGIANFRLAFRYVGDFGNEWSLEDVLVNDTPANSAPRWPNLPTAAISAEGLVEDFEGIAGIPPAHMAINRVDEGTRFADDSAWCNIGQLGASQFAFGNYSLEMGVDPSFPTQHYYSNALILKLDGSNSGKLWMEFDALNHGEEGNPDDGVFLSLDGLQWAAILNDWDGATGGFPNLGTWQRVRVQLTSYLADTSGEFYVAICEADNRPYGIYDGLAVDNIKVFSEPDLQAFGKGPGFPGTIGIDKCQPGSLVEVMYSKVGPGPTDTAYGLMDLSQPILSLGKHTADASGQVILSGQLPPWMAGTSVWVQAGMLWGDIAIVSNSLALHF